MSTNGSHKPSGLELALELAGFFAAHAVWSVSDGETLIPMGGSEITGGKRELIRFAADTFEEGVAHGQKWLEQNPTSALRAVLIFDGFITLESGKSDALMVVVRDYAGGGEATWALPYRPAKARGGFAVYRPKVVAIEDPDQIGMERIAQAFFNGADQHEQGSKVWNDHLDESR